MINLFQSVKCLYLILIKVISSKECVRLAAENFLPNLHKVPKCVIKGPDIKSRVAVRETSRVVVTGINYGENSHGREVHASFSRRWRAQMRKQCNKVVTALLSA